MIRKVRSSQFLDTFYGSGGSGDDTLKISLHWGKPIPLRSGRRDTLIYTIDDLDMVPTNAGVYVFGRLNRGELVPLYIGQAQRLRSRIKSQFNNVSLMLGIQGSPGRRRVLVPGELVAKPGQQLVPTLNIVEKALIEAAAFGGYELLNQQGTNPKTDTIRFSGSKAGRSWLPRELMAFRQRRRRRC